MRRLLPLFFLAIMGFAQASDEILYTTPEGLKVGKGFWIRPDGVRVEVPGAGELPAHLTEPHECQGLSGIELTQCQNRAVVEARLRDVDPAELREALRHADAEETNANLRAINSKLAR